MMNLQPQEVRLGRGGLERSCEQILYFKLKLGENWNTDLTSKKLQFELNSGFVKSTSDAVEIENSLFNLKM